MRTIDTIVLVCGLVAATTWIIFSGKDGFKGNSAVIVARSISVSATMDGQVDNNPPAVGSKFSSDDLLVRIRNSRVDRTRLAEFESQVEYLEHEIANVDSQQRELAAMLEEFEQRARAHAQWMERDVELRKTMNMRQLEVARMRAESKDEEVERLKRLLKSSHASEVNVKLTMTESEIAHNEVALARSELGRSDLLLRSLQAGQVQSEDGDSSYWARMADTVRMRFFDNRGRIALLTSELHRATTLARAEAEHVETSFTEEHRAPFSGVVNAALVARGARVASGTGLLQVLDCSHPTVVIPIPDHRIGEFVVGMKATVYPIDSELSLAGTITHISSGPLLGGDTTMQLEQSLTLRGNRAIVEFDDHGAVGELSESCDTARKAVAIIHTDSVFEAVASWLSSSAPMVAWNGIGRDAAAATLPR